MRLTFQEFENQFENVDEQSFKDEVKESFWGKIHAGKRLKLKKEICPTLVAAGVEIEYDEIKHSTGWFKKGVGEKEFFTAFLYYIYLKSENNDLCKSEIKRVFGVFGISGGGVSPDAPQPVLIVPKKHDNVFHFASDEALEVIGRVDERKKLRKFLNDKGPNFAWMQIAGEAGQGKSRLGLDLVQYARNKRKEPWEAGFLFHDDSILYRSDISAFDEHWRTWQPDRNHLLVVDYVSGREEQVARLMEGLAARSGEKHPNPDVDELLSSRVKPLRHKVRLLLLERQRWDWGGGERSADSADRSSAGDGTKTVMSLRARLGLGDGRAAWYDVVRKKIADGNTSASLDLLERSPINGGVIELEHLDEKALKSLVLQTARQLEPTFDLPPKKIEERLEQIDQSGRPLYAYFLGAALGAGTFEAGWTHEELLRDTLERERETRWQRLCTGEIPNIASESPAMRLAVLATICRGIDSDEDLHRAGLPAVSAETCREARILTGAPAGTRADGRDSAIPGLEPDLLGEWLVLDELKPGRHAEDIMRAAWKMKPEKTAEFLVRLARDFPAHPMTIRLLDCEPTELKALNAYADVSPAIIKHLLDSKVELTDALITVLQRAAESGEAAALRTLGNLHLEGISVDQSDFEGFRLTQQAAEKGDLGGMFNLGVCYQEGTGVEADATEAVAWHRKAAEKDHAGGMVNLGFCYQNGIGVEVDAARAVAWYRRAADKGDAGGMVNLGFCYQNGIGVAADAAEAVAWYRKAAEKDDAGAMFNLGVCYRNGIGVAADAAEAVAWYRKAAERDHAGGMVNLGFCYQNGIGVAADAAEAVAWYRRAAEKDHAGAMFNLGLCYQNGMGVAADAAEAVAWYRKAAKKDDAGAMFNLGVCSEHGIGVAVDAVQAVAWYRKAAEKDHAGGMVNLGVCYRNGIGVAADAAEAVAWYRKAAEKDHAGGMVNLGDCYENGIGVAADAAEAVAWYLRAAEKDHAGGMTNLGFCYQNGIGVAADAAEAVAWYRQAAEKDHAGAIFNLGLSYQNGMGVAADAAQAVAWYRRAAEKDLAAGMFNLGICYQNGIGVAPDAAQAVAWYRRAAEKDGAGAMFNLGVCYQNGMGVAADAVQAVAWYREAAEKDHAPAMFNLGVCYRNGIGVTVDTIQAVAWYRKAAEKDYAGGMFNLGVCYENGIGVAADAAQAGAWYRRAAEKDHAGAIFNLGVCYQNGIGVAADAARATAWYRKAAGAGDATAMLNLAVNHFNGTGLERPDFVQAVHWARKARDAGLEGVEEMLQLLDRRQPESERVAEALSCLSGKPWPTSPLIPGIWTDLHGTDAEPAATLTLSFPAVAEQAQLVLRGLRSCDLTFYPGFSLHEALFEDEGEQKIACVLSGPGATVLFNGKSPIVHNLNKLALIDLSTLDLVTDYLQFFCMANFAPEGHFRLLDALDPDLFEETVEPDVLDKLAVRIRPITVTGETDSEVTLTATLKYATGLFHADFAVSRQENNRGMVELKVNEQIAVELPLFWEGFDGVLRWRTKWEKRPNAVTDPLAD